MYHAISMDVFICYGSKISTQIGMVRCCMATLTQKRHKQFASRWTLTLVDLVIQLWR
jgi:hypothetical protein